MPTMPPTFRAPGAVKGKRQIDRDYKRRRKHHPDQRFLKTRLWTDRIRPAQLAREPYCRHCDARGRVTVATQVDHVKVPNGDETLQRAAWNLQSLCAPCHGRKTREDQGMGRSNL